MKNPDQVRDNNLPPLATGPEIYHPCLVFCIGQKDQLPIPLSYKWQPSQPPGSQNIWHGGQSAGAATTSVTAEFIKWVASKSSQVSPSDCICLHEGATKDPSLILGSLEIAPCKLPNMGRSLMELQKVLHASWGIPYFLSISQLSLSIEYPPLWSSICSALNIQPSHFSSEGLQHRCPLKRIFSCLNGFKRGIVLIFW